MQDDWIDEELENAARRMCGQVEASAMFLALVPEEPDVAVLLQLGAAVFYDKPVIALAVEGRPVNENMRRLARVTIVGPSVDDPAVQDALTKALEDCS